MSERTEHLKRKIEFSQKAAKATGILAAVVTLIAVIVMIFQLIHLQNSVNDQRDAQAKNAEEQLKKALEANRREHVRTQQYIQCVASVLLKPIAERSEDDFNNCGIPGTKGPITSNAKQEEYTSVVPYAPLSQQPATTAAPQTPSTSRINQPTTSTPPPPVSQPSESPGLLRTITKPVTNLLNTIF